MLEQRESYLEAERTMGDLARAIYRFVLFLNWRTRRSLVFVSCVLIILGMCESNYPKDDRDDALTYLTKALKLTGALGLEDLESRIKQRHEHIDAIFNSQFRGR